MDADKQALLVRATKALKLRDVMLYQSRFTRPTTNHDDAIEHVFQQHKRSVAYTAGDLSAAEAGAARLLQVRVSLGTRVVHRTDGDEADTVLFEIEADYLVEYSMDDDLPDDALKAFAEFNAIHNAWPFWREHVFSIVGRGRLPRLEVPLFEGEVL